MATRRLILPFNKYSRLDADILQHKAQVKRLKTDIMSARLKSLKEDEIRLQKCIDDFEAFHRDMFVLPNSENMTVDAMNKSSTNDNIKKAKLSVTEHDFSLNQTECSIVELDGSRNAPEVFVSQHNYSVNQPGCSIVQLDGLMNAPEYFVSQQHCSVNQPESSVNEPDHSLDQPGCSIIQLDSSGNAPEYFVSQQHCSVNQPESSVNETCCSMNQPDHSVNSQEYSVNQLVCLVNQPDNLMNQPNSSVNDTGYSMNQPSLKLPTESFQKTDSSETESDESEDESGDTSDKSNRCKNKSSSCSNKSNRCKDKPNSCSDKSTDSSDNSNDSSDKYNISSEKTNDVQYEYIKMDSIEDRDEFVKKVLSKLLEKKESEISKIVINLIYTFSGFQNRLRAAETNLTQLRISPRESTDHFESMLKELSDTVLVLDKTVFEIYSKYFEMLNDIL